MFGYAYSIFLFPHSLQGFAARYMNILELGSTKREEDLHITGKQFICELAFLFDIGKIPLIPPPNPQPILSL